MWSVPIELEPELRLGTAVKVLDIGSIDGLEPFTWAVLPEGEGHLFVRGESGGQEFTQLHVVLNFHTELERRLPPAEQ